EAAQQRGLLHGTGDTWLQLPPPPRSQAEPGNARERGSASRTASPAAPGSGRQSLQEARSQAEPGNEERAEGAIPHFQYKGLVPALDEASRVSFVYRQRLAHLVSEVPCSTCGGSRLREDAAATRWQNYTLGQLCDLPLGQTLALFKNLQLPKQQQQVAGEVLREITNRLQFLVDVGLEYLTLNRPAPTLSGGESQRIRLASQIGSGLTGVLYVLDEPTIGL